MLLNIHVRLLAFIAGALVLAACGSKPDDRSNGTPGDVARETGATADSSAIRLVRVAAAADLKFALDDIIASFITRAPSFQIKVSYGSSGSFYSQLSNEAPFDVFLSADIQYPEKLVAGGQGDRSSLFHYAVGQIVLWVPSASTLDVEGLGMRVLTEPGIRKIAIANPQHAPYGRAAEAAMKSLGVYDAVKSRLVLGENIAQTAQFVESGAADAGIIALSLAMAPSMRDKGRYWTIPLDAYPRLEQGGVILSWAQDQEAAAAFIAYMGGPDGRNILRDYGFIMPGE